MNLTKNKLNKSPIDDDTIKMQQFKTNLDYLNKHSKPLMKYIFCIFTWLDVPVYDIIFMHAFHSEQQIQHNLTDLLFREWLFS